MPIIKSAKKRVKVAAKANLRNVKTKRVLRESLKAFNKALSSGKPETIASAQREVVSAIDKATKKNVMHKNKAARQKARLSANAKAAGSKITKTVAKKATKPATKKVVVKKKPPVKKTVPKK